MKKLLLLLFFPLLWVSCDSNSSTPINVVFTCDTQGRLEPCGCFTGQYGGLARIASKSASFNDSSSLRLDAGDAMPGKEDFNIILYKYVQQAFKLMKFDAMNIGAREAQLSLNELKSIDLKLGPPLISANLVDKSTMQPIFQSSVMIERNGLRIAVVGVLDPEIMGEELGEGLALEDMAIAITRSLESSEPADMHVLLAFCDEAKMKKLATQFFEFDLILGGKVRQPSQKLIRENRSLILATTNQAKNIGYLQADFSSKTGLGKVEFDIPLLYEHFPENASILGFAKQYRDEIRKSKLTIDSPHNHQEDLIPGVATQAVYVGTQTCNTCHTEAHKVWENSAHAKAFETLKMKDADADPRCIKCHTVGFSEESGYLRAFSDTKLTNVGCESCHGPGSEHVRQRQSGEQVLLTYRPLGQASCQECHYGEFSRPFNWSKMWPIIEHHKEKK